MATIIEITMNKTYCTNYSSFIQQILMNVIQIYVNMNRLVSILPGHITVTVSLDIKGNYVNKVYYFNSNKIQLMKKTCILSQTKNMKQCMQYESLYVATQVVHKSTQQSSWRERLLYTP